MSAVLSFAPDAITQEYGRSTLPQRRLSPGAVGGLDGPGNVGPEHAGALSLVFGTFADSDSAQRGYQRFADAQCGLLDAPGFLRWISFADGPHGYGLGLWRTADDASGFARGRLHQQLVQEQREKPFEYSQFAGIWTAHQIGRRTFTCPSCQATAAAPSHTCPSCGAALDDGFA
jgi:hypothetical protein